MLPVKAFLRFCFVYRLLSGNVATFDCIRGKEEGRTNSEEKGRKTGEGRRLATENGPTPLQAAIFIGFIDNPYRAYFYYVELLRKILKITRDGIIA